MEITVKVVKENKDGSADALIHFDKEGLEFLVQEGVLVILKQFIEQSKNAQAGIKMRKKLTTKKAQK
jgi:hypothetical protein